MDDDKHLFLPTASNAKPTISPAQAERLLKVLTDKGCPDAKCERCANNTWNVLDQLAALPLVGLGDDGIPFSSGTGISMLFAVLICTGCGNTKLMHLEEMGFDLKAEL